MDERLALLRARLTQGVVIPACPLALTADRRFDARHQRGLIRYYGDAGAGGLAVGVHTTQFAIHDPRVGLYQPVLEIAAETMRTWPGESSVDDVQGPGFKVQGSAVGGQRSAVSHQSAVGDVQPSTFNLHPPAVGGRPIAVAGLVGDTSQATREAALAVSLGYDCGLLSLAALREADDDALIAHCRAVAEVIPLFGFYLQPAVGGRALSYGFWRRFAEIERVVAIKIAPFNRYQTLDVVRAVADSGRGGEIALYTGNDDHIIEDLLAEFWLGQTPISPPLFRGKGEVGGEVGLRIVGGLLGHWAVWTRRAAEILAACHAAHDGQAQARGQAQGLPLRVWAAQVTDCNAALFDVAHGFAGCIAGIHEVLRRQGLLAGRWCLDPHEDLSPGQSDEIDRVCAAYPHLTDDDFIAQNLDRWLA
jgi:hypothetical protein